MASSKSFFSCQFDNTHEVLRLPSVPTHVGGGAGTRFVDDSSPISINDASARSSYDSSLHHGGEEANGKENRKRENEHKRRKRGNENEGDAGGEKKGRKSSDEGRLSAGYHHQAAPPHHPSFPPVGHSQGFPLLPSQFPPPAWYPQYPLPVLPHHVYPLQTATTTQWPNYYSQRVQNQATALEVWRGGIYQPTQNHSGAILPYILPNHPPAVIAHAPERGAIEIRREERLREKEERRTKQRNEKEIMAKLVRRKENLRVRLLTEKDDSKLYREREDVEREIEELRAARGKERQEKQAAIEKGRQEKQAAIEKGRQEKQAANEKGRQEKQAREKERQEEQEAREKERREKEVAFVKELYKKQAARETERREKEAVWQEKHAAREKERREKEAVRQEKHAAREKVRQEKHAAREKVRQEEQEAREKERRDAAALVDSLGHGADPSSVLQQIDDIFRRSSLNVDFGARSAFVKTSDSNQQKLLRQARTRRDILSEYQRKLDRRASTRNAVTAGKEKYASAPLPAPSQLEIENNQIDLLSYAPDIELLMSLVHDDTFEVSQEYA